MKVALDGRRLRKNPAGVGGYVFQIITYLLSRGVECVVFVPDNNELPVFPATTGLTLVKVPASIAVGRERFATENRLFAQLLEKHQPDLYHATDNMGIPKTTIPTVLTIHDVIPWVTGEYLNIWTKYLYKKALRLSVKRADRIITISNHTKTELEKYLCVPESKITTIYNGFTVSAEESKPALTLPDRYFVYVGGLGPRKNIANTIRAYHQFLEAHPDGPALVLVGEKKPTIEKEYRLYLDLINQLKLTEKVVFTGYLSDAELTYVRARAELVLYVSTYEGFGLPILEAMAQNVPVITSNVSAMPEVAGDAALTVDPTSVKDISRGITELYTNKGLRQQLITAGQKRVKDFSWSKTAEAIYQVYQEVIRA